MKIIDSIDYQGIIITNGRITIVSPKEIEEELIFDDKIIIINYNENEEPLYNYVENINLVGKDMGEYFYKYTKGL